MVTFRGMISIREDPVGITTALIWPFSLPAPSHARQVAQNFVALVRSANPSFQAWQQGNATPDSDRITLRTRQMKYGRQLEGNFNLLVNGTDAIISGYECPVEASAQRSLVMASILSTFRTSELMPRQVVQEPSEGAYTISLPTGWLFQGGVNRNNIGGSALPQYVISRDPQGQVVIAMP